MRVKVRTRCATLEQSELITSGSAGMTVEIEFSREWSGLNKTAVFSAGSVQRDVIISGDTVTIPWECLQTANKSLYMGVYGADSGGNTIIPTIYVALGIIRPGADPSGDPSTDPTLPVWGQITEKIGDLYDLSTEDKSNLVAAINEIFEHGGGAGTDDHNELENRDMDNQHPMSAITGLEDALDSKANASDIPSLDGYATTQDLENATSDMATQTWVESKGYITAADIPVLSVNGKTGTVTLTAADLGLTTVFNLKGSKPTYTALPASGNVIGDVWYVVDESVGYIWLNDGTTNRWEQLGLSVDLSNYVTTEALATALTGYVAKVAGKGLSTNDFTDAYKTKLDSAITSLAGYRTAEEQDLIDADKQTKVSASGILKGDGDGGVSAATPGTDYQEPLETVETSSIGIDNAPTSGSNNLVKSGGVYSAIDAKEAKGKITISGVEKTANTHTVTIVTNGVTTTMTLVGVS